MKRVKINRSSASMSKSWWGLLSPIIRCSLSNRLLIPLWNDESSAGSLNKMYMIRTSLLLNESCDIPTMLITVTSLMQGPPACWAPGCSPSTPCR